MHHKLYMALLISNKQSDYHILNPTKNIISDNSKIPKSKYIKVLLNTNFIKSNLTIYINA